MLLQHDGEITELLTYTVNFVYSPALRTWGMGVLYDRGDIKCWPDELPKQRKELVRPIVPRCILFWPIPMKGGGGGKVKLT